MALTRDELAQAFKEAKRLGKFEDAYRIEQQLKAMDAQENPPEPPVEQSRAPMQGLQEFVWKMRHSPEFQKGFGKEVLQGASLGLSDEIGAAAAATAAGAIDGAPIGETYREMRDNIRADQAAFRGENPGSAVTANLIGGIATGGKFFGTKTGAAAGGATAGYGYSNEEHPVLLARDTLAGAGLGLGGQIVLSGAGRLVGDVIRRRLARGGTPAVDDAGMVTDEAIDALEREVHGGGVSPEEANDFLSQIEGVLTPEQLRRVQLFQRHGVKPMRADVTQRTDDFREMQEALKRSGKLAEEVAGQEAQIINRVERGIDEIMPNTATMPETNANVFQVVDDVVGQYEGAVTQAYKTARELAQSEPIVGYGRLMTMLRQNTGKNQITGGLIGAVRQELKNRGIVTQGWKPNGRTNVETAEEVRQVLNSFFDPQNPQRNMLIRELKTALDDDVAAVVGNDVFKPARDSNIALKNLVKRSKRDRRDKTKRTFFEDVLDNRIPEEKIVPRLLTGRDDDMAFFKNFLLKDAGEAGVQAWNNIRAQVIRDALGAATKVMGKREGGQQVFNSRAFRDHLMKLTNSKKFNMLFNADERQFIRDIIEIGRLRTPQQNVQQGAGPSAVSVDTLRQHVVRRLDSNAGFLERMFQELLSHKDVSRQLNPVKETEAYLRGVPRQ